MFVNIVYGCNSILVIKIVLRLVDYVVIEVGFGVDFGGEKFLDIKVFNLKKVLDVVVIVVIICVLKMYGGMKKDEFKNENFDVLKIGFVNLKCYICNME